MLQLVAFWHRDNRKIAKPSMAYQRFGDLGNLAVLDQGLLEYSRLFGAVFEGCKQAFGILAAFLLFASGEGRNFRERFVERTPGHLEFDLECDRRDFRINAVAKATDVSIAETVVGSPCVATVSNRSLKAIGVLHWAEGTVNPYKDHLRTALIYLNH